MNPESVRRELRTLLTRAATLEAERQKAQQSKDWPTVTAAERELAALWRRHSELEAAAA
jgi:hypothetical protein